MSAVWQLKIIIIVSLWIPVAATAREPAPSDDTIRSLLIEDSIAAYSGKCPCPYSTMRNGRRCGGNSAYSRPSGRAPLCYPKDITQAMIDRFRKFQSSPEAR